MSFDLTGLSSTTPLYSTAVAARLAGLHPQTLRSYDRLGMVVPARISRGGNRLYSSSDIMQLREISALSGQGMPLEAIRTVLELRKQVEDLRGLVEELTREKTRTALVVWRPQH